MDQNLIAVIVGFVEGVTEFLPVPERKREAGLPAERAAKYGRNQFVPPGAVSQMTFPG